MMLAQYMSAEEREERHDRQLADERAEKLAELRSRVVCDYIYPPIPVRDHDWQATLRDYDEGDPIGYGHTRDFAIEDLMSQLEERL
jgi:hypothetical protein